ncbi:HNRNPUL1, partial [Symbiodinium pilosum]
FSTARSSPIMGDNEDSVCFDSDGGLLFNRKRVPLLEAKYGPESTMAVVLNLDQDSPNVNTLTLYRDGQRVADPQLLPESLQGK